MGDFPHLCIFTNSNRKELCFVEHELLLLIDQVNNETIFSEMDVYNSMFNMINKDIIMMESLAPESEESELVITEASDAEMRQTGILSKAKRILKNLIQRIKQLLNRISLAAMYGRVLGLYKNVDHDTKIPSPIDEATLIKITKSLTKLCKYFKNSQTEKTYGGAKQYDKDVVKEVFDNNLIPTFNKLHLIANDSNSLMFGQRCRYGVFKDSLKVSDAFSKSLSTYCNTIDYFIDHSKNNIDGDQSIYVNIIQNCFKTLTAVFKLYVGWCKYLINHDPNSGEPVNQDKNDKDALASFDALNSTAKPWSPPKPKDSNPS